MQDLQNEFWLNTFYQKRNKKLLKCAADITKHDEHLLKNATGITILTRLRQNVLSIRKHDKTKLNSLNILYRLTNKRIWPKKSFLFPVFVNLFSEKLFNFFHFYCK